MQPQLQRELESACDRGLVPLLRCVLRELRSGPGVDADAVFAAGLERLQQAAAEAGLQARIRGIVGSWAAGLQLVPALVRLGVLPRRGFRAEMARRLYDSLNPPPAPGEESLGQVLRRLFRGQADLDWINAIGDGRWRDLFQWLGLWGDALLASGPGEAWREQALEAMDKLAVWVAAEELEEELIRLDPKILTRPSAFSALQREVASFVADYRAWRDGSLAEYHDGAHVRVLLDQCVTALASYRRRGLRMGATVSLTYLLERLDQTLRRIGQLLDISGQRPRTAEAPAQSALLLWRELALGAVERNSMGALWRRTTGLLARNVSDNASEHGGHYVTSDRRGYIRMLVSAAGAGLIIPVMALLKIKIAALQLPLLPQTVLYCLDYGLGFMLIHVLGFTVATKQPAMTAAHLSSAIEREGRSGANARTVVELATQVIRTQFIAIVGNVAVALTVAALLARAYANWEGVPTLSYQESVDILYGLHPFAGLALLHAAIAGVWLFLSGLIAGYFDNRFDLLQLGKRFEQHPLWRRLLPATLRSRFAHWLEHHYGALWGNFLFGCLLGVTGMFGYLLGLPIDIRHVAFSAANLGFVGLPSFPLFAAYLFFVLMIGAVNLGVSFLLAMTVALRARGLRLQDGGGVLRALWHKLAFAPWEFVLPPTESKPRSGGK